MTTSNRSFRNRKALGGLVALLLLTGIGVVTAIFRSGAAATDPARHDGSMAMAAVSDTTQHSDMSNTAPQGGLAAYDTNGDGIVYQDGMHPWYVQDEPGIAPDCGMELTPVRIGESDAGTVKIDPVTIQNIGVRSAMVAVEALGRTVRTTGRFAANEQAQVSVSPKIGGWIETLHVDYEGARVRKGDPLLEIYSPELVSTQEEYLLALRNARRLAGSAAAQDAQRLVEAARRRLTYWDISDAQIRALEDTGTPRKTLTLYAPAAGTVMRKNVVEGQRIQPGQALMEIVDLSQLWLMVDVYEQDLAWVSEGTMVHIELPYDPGEVRMGRVDYIYDNLDAETRTVKARATLANPDRRLKPGMYAVAELVGRPTRPGPIIPEEALIRTGEKELVILALGDGRFRPQPVQAGVQADGKMQILDGLQGHERVVTSAQFLIDSEARLKSAIGAMAGHDHESLAEPQSDQSQSASGGHVH